MPRHSSLSEQLSGLMAYRNQSEADPEPVETNWKTSPANDNDPEEIVDMRHERDLRMTPSIEEIMRSVATNDVERNEAGQIVRIGKLRFSDGTQTEKAEALGIDGDVITIDARMPAGAMLGTREKPERAAGGQGGQSYTKMSNDYFAEVLDTAPHRYRPRNDRRRGVNRTAEESRADLAAAIANTAVMPEVKRYPDALPCGQKKAADAFVGMRMMPAGKGGMMAWEDLATRKEGRKQWRAVLRDLRAEDRTVLDAAMGATSMSSLVPGKRGGNAAVAGKKRLQVANDNLMKIIREKAA